MSEKSERGTIQSLQEKKQYRAFGLNIRSEVPLQMEGISEGSWDVDVCLDELPKEWLDDPRAPAGYVEQEKDNFWFVWSELGVMKIEKSRRITLDPALDLTTNYVHQAIQSAGMGLILHQRGALTLHASAVAIDDGIVGFVGYKGAGKSTTAASFFSRGYPLVTDDLLVIELAENADAVSVNAAYGYPGIPRLRLWPDSVRASLGILLCQISACVKRLGCLLQKNYRFEQYMSSIFSRDDGSVSNRRASATNAVLLRVQ